MTDYQPNEHVLELLPAYVNLTLDSVTIVQVHQHLSICSQCQIALTDWEAIANTAQEAAMNNALPSALVLTQTLNRIDASLSIPGEIQNNHVTLWRSKFWLFVIKQRILFRHPVWRGSTITMLLGSLIACTAHNHVLGELVLALVTPIVAAMSATVIYEPEMLLFQERVSSSAQVRLILLTRIGLVFGYYSLLALVATITLCTLRGDRALWSVVTLWLGPTLLLSALSLTGSLLFNSKLAVFGAFSLWTLRIVILAASSWQLPGSTSNPFNGFWQTNSMMLASTLLLLAISLAYLPRRV